MASEPLEAARRLVQQSDAEQGRKSGAEMALRGETRALRDALRALIDHSERLEERVTRLEGRTGLIA